MSSVNFFVASHNLAYLMSKLLPIQFLVSELKSIDTNNKSMVSLDVNSLLTNIPLTESIDLAVSSILQNNSSLKLSTQDLTKLFSFATAQTHFLFNGNTYDQIDGVSMGSPLAPVLANLFMGHHEKIWLENFNNSDVLIYRRYIMIFFAYLLRNLMLFHSLILSTNNTPTSHFPWKKKLIRD